MELRKIDTTEGNISPKVLDFAPQKKNDFGKKTNIFQKKPMLCVHKCLNYYNKFYLCESVAFIVSNGTIKIDLKHSQIL